MASEGRSDQQVALAQLRAMAGAGATTEVALARQMVIHVTQPGGWPFNLTLLNDIAGAWSIAKATDRGVAPPVTLEIIPATTAKDDRKRVAVAFFQTLALEQHNIVLSEKTVVDHVYKGMSTGHHYTQPGYYTRPFPRPNAQSEDWRAVFLAAAAHEVGTRCI